MSFLGLCDGDPLVETLTEVFGTNIVRIPEERIQPVCVLTSYDGKSAFRGKLSSMLVGDPNVNISIATSQMADVSGKRSRKVSFELGFTILDGFLKGFGIPSSGIGLKLQGASEVSFTFKDVLRAYVDINLLGRLLTGRAIDMNNPAAAIFFQDSKYTFLVIDSVITSTDFAISVDKSSDQGFKLDVPAIQNIVSQANVGVSVSTTSGYDLVFKGNKHLAFAFSCVRLYLDSNGTITSMPPEAAVPALSLALEGLNSPSYSKIHYSPDRIILSRTSGMLSWDSLSNANYQINNYLGCFLSRSDSCAERYGSRPAPINQGKRGNVSPEIVRRHFGYCADQPCRTLRCLAVMPHMILT